ncbi:hypothetical protein KUV57_11440 [Epibacterium sp. DP7N7-1]|nr:hypothetical protein [Epibacterium sp. DP7N7-1]
MSTKSTQPSQKDIDEAALANFTETMRKKLAKSREKGRDGWHDPDLCPVERLASMMVGHLGKPNEGNLVDIATFAMMLHERGARPDILLQAMAAPRSVIPVCRDKIRFDDGGEVEIDPVWVVEVDGVVIECEDEGKAKTIASAINARSRPRADLEMIAQLRHVLEPLAAFADIPGAGCVPGEVKISKSVERDQAPALTFANARDARAVSQQAALRQGIFEAMRPIDTAAAAAIGRLLHAARLEAGEAGDIFENCIVAIQSDPDIPLLFREEIGDATGYASEMPDRMDLLRALEPFARFGVGEEGQDIVESLMGDRVKDWLGWDDFMAMRKVYSALSGNALPAPAAVDGADQNELT